MKNQEMQATLNKIEGLLTSSRNHFEAIQNVIQDRLLAIAALSTEERRAYRAEERQLNRLLANVDAAYELADRSLHLVRNC